MMSQSMNYNPGSNVAELMAERNALAAEVERLRDDVSTANQDATRLVYELANLGIRYDGFDPLRRLVEEVTALRSQLEAANQWRPVTEPPPGAGWYQILDSEGTPEHVYYDGVAWPAEPPQYWRVVPPAPAG